MKQFNLDEYLANPTKKLITRDGRPVRIICTDAKYYDYPIIALISLEDGTEVVCPYTKKGVRFNIRQEGDGLFFALEKHEGWINLYSGMLHGSVFNSEEEAKSAVLVDDSYIATVKIEWEE